MTTRFFSESESLRRCNLASTPRWREFLRSRLEPLPTSTGTFYDSEEVEALARKISEIPDELRPTEDTSTLTRSNRADGLVDRRGPSA